MTGHEFFRAIVAASTGSHRAAWRLQTPIVKCLQENDMHLQHKFFAHAEIALPVLALIAATRGMAGIGLGLLLSDHVPKPQRNRIAWTLLMTGAISTIPLVAAVRSAIRRAER
jgi:hypothetical protein